MPERSVEISRLRCFDLESKYLVWRDKLYIRIKFTFSPGYARCHFRPWPLTYWVSLCVFLFQCLDLFLTPRGSTAKASGSVLWEPDQERKAVGRSVKNPRAESEPSDNSPHLMLVYKWIINVLWYQMYWESWPFKEVQWGIFCKVVSLTNRFCFGQAKSSTII